MKMDAGYDKMNIIFRIFCIIGKTAYGALLN